MRVLAIALLLVPATVVAQEPASAPAAEKPAATTRKDFSTMDRLELGSTVVTGNRELPKVMYVVPWKRADLGDLGGKPLNSLVDEVLTPVDRDVFERETGYFRALDRASEPKVETFITAGESAP